MWVWSRNMNGWWKNILKPKINRLFWFWKKTAGNICNIYLVYKRYILPIGWLYATYHLMQEPETSVEKEDVRVFLRPLTPKLRWILALHLAAKKLPQEIIGDVSTVGRVVCVYRQNDHLLRLQWINLTIIKTRCGPRTLGYQVRSQGCEAEAQYCNPQTRSMCVRIEELLEGL